jgi:hypothetical protein
MDGNGIIGKPAYCGLLGYSLATLPYKQLS